MLGWLLATLVVSSFLRRKFPAVGKFGCSLLNALQWLCPVLVSPCNTADIVGVCSNGWEVWLQVAKRIGTGRSSILTRIWDWREANRLQSIRLLPQTQDAGSRLDLSNPLGFVIVFTLALTTPNHGLFLRAVSINMEAAGLEGNHQWGNSLPSRWLNAKEYG